MFRTLWTSRNLLFNLVRRDLTVRYKSTVLGFFWSFAKPLAYMTIYHMIFNEILKIKIVEPKIPYGLHVLTGILAWSFFTGATTEAMNSIIASSNLVKKVKLPLEVFPLSAVIGQAVHFAAAMFVLLIALVPFGLTPGPGILLTVAVFALQFMLAWAVAMLLAALNVFYRDVGSLWEVAVSAWFYATPIVYPAYEALGYFRETGRGWLSWLYLANPMAPITIAYRRLMLYGGPGVESTEIPDGQLWAALGSAAVFSAAMFWFSRSVFRRLSRRFADEL